MPIFSASSVCFKPVSFLKRRRFSEKVILPLFLLTDTMMSAVVQTAKNTIVSVNSFQEIFMDDYLNGLYHYLTEDCFQKPLSRRTMRRKLPGLNTPSNRYPTHSLRNSKHCISPMRRHTTASSTWNSAICSGKRFVWPGKSSVRPPRRTAPRCCCQ